MDTESQRAIEEEVESYAPARGDIGGSGGAGSKHWRGNSGKRKKWGGSSFLGYLRQVNFEDEISI